MSNALTPIQAGFKTHIGSTVVAKRGNLNFHGTLRWVGTAGVRIDTDAKAEYLGWSGPAGEPLMLRVVR